MYKTALLLVAAFCATAVLGVPTLRLKTPVETAVETPIPNGDYYGTINIYPYQRSGSGYACVHGCSGPVSAPARMIFYQNSLSLNISASQNHGCGLGTQSYYIYNIDAYGPAYPYYYAGQVFVEGVNVKTCFYFDHAGTFKIKFDGQGSCPAQTDPPQCTAGWSAGSVTQIWSGAFSPSTVPAGSYYGTMSVVPYTQAQNKYTCTTCYPVSTSINVAWNGDTAILSMQGGGSHNCVLFTQSYSLSQVTEYGPSYPNYYYGQIKVEGYDIPICFYWDSFGNVVFKIDGQGNCPATSDQATCINSAWYPGTVTQTWVGHVAQHSE